MISTQEVISEIVKIQNEERKIMTDFELLRTLTISDREVFVLELAVEGKSLSEIGNRLTKLTTQYDHLKGKYMWKAGDKGVSRTRVLSILARTASKRFRFARGLKLQNKKIDETLRKYAPPWIKEANYWEEIIE